MRFLIFIFVSLTVFPKLQAQTAPKWELILQEDHSDFGALQCRDLDADLWAALQRTAEIEDQLINYIKVFANEVAAVNFSSNAGMLGTFHFQDSSLLFKPRFPFIEGQSYQVAIDGPALRRLLHWEENPNYLSSLHQTQITIPTSKALPPASVAEIYPSNSQIPANLLKCYLQFAQPMSLESVYPHIRLLDESGEPVAAPFLELSPELWDPQHQRLTLWLDPGRIKSHLIPNQKMGPPLQSGRVYTLVIDTTFKDAHGQYLAKPFHKTFFTTPPDRQKPAIVNWDIIPPPAASRGPLVLLFPEALDVGVLESSIAVFDVAGQLLEGEIKIGRTEKSWLFTPHAPWSSGKYKLRISKDLEDLAGNNMERLFDTTLTGEEAETEEEESPQLNYIQLEVEIKSEE